MNKYSWAVMFAMLVVLAGLIQRRITDQITDQISELRWRINVIELRQKQLALPPEYQLRLSKPVTIPDPKCPAGAKWIPYGGFSHLEIKDGVVDVDKSGWKTDASCLSASGGEWSPLKK